LTTSEQLPLDLGHRPALGREDFLVSDSNSRAVAAIEAWGAWPGARMALIGPARAGKTHMAEVWRALSGAGRVQAGDLDPATSGALAATAMLVEDVDRLGEGGRRAAAEEGLLHLHNAMTEAGRALLVTGRGAPARWGVAMPDLASRLEAMPVARIEPADDALLSSVIVKLAADRRLRLAPGVVRYLLRRMERSIAVAERVVAALDRRSLARQRPPGLAMAGEVLEEIGRAS